MSTKRQTKPFSTTTTIHNLFLVRKHVTVCIIATVVVQLCSNISVLANSQPSSLIGDEPVQPPQPAPVLPPQPVPRARPPPRRRPRPAPGGAGEGLLCLGSDLAINRKFKDEKYMKEQLDCALSKGPCDETGKMIKRLAPDVLKGHCPRPCNICTRRQIKRVMAMVQRKYPREFSEMLRSFSYKTIRFEREKKLNTIFML